MTAMASAIEMFFSTCGACASAGAAARTDADASAARLTRRMMGLPGHCCCALLKPCCARISPCLLAEIEFGGKASAPLPTLLGLPEALLEPHQFGLQIPLHISHPHLDHPVVAGLKPGPPRGAISDDG